MDESPQSRHDRWARLRFSIIGPLLASPPERGDLGGEIRKLAQKTWRHPISGEAARFGPSTIERWYYTARNERQDPVGALRRRVRKDAGHAAGVSAALGQALRAQHRAHPSWSAQLHADNLAVLVKGQPELGPMPSYSTIRRWMKAQGLFRRRRFPQTPGGQRAEHRLDTLEVRSFEAAYVGGLWHLDFHVGRRKVLTRDGRWSTPHLLGVLDDRSRLACHVQWYLSETAETLIHGLSQALQKRGLCRALMTDNGSAMLAGETVQGLAVLGILHETTLPHSPYQNAKQEVFWAPLEGRLMAMLEDVKDLTLDLLNEATQAWAEMEYNRRVHSETGQTPLRRFLDDRSVLRESPSSDALRQAFRMTTLRTQRRSDGTVSIEGARFEVPSRFRHLERLLVRYARWDLRTVDLVDSRTNATLGVLYPLDKTRNAEGHRRSLEAPPDPAPPLSGEVAPLLKELMARYSATGLPPAYLPKPEETR
jgi:transposase InsO family protein